MKLLLDNLNGIRKDFLDQENDYLLVVDGREGSGKSSLALQLAEYIDPEFCVSKIAFSGREFLNIIGTVKDGSAVVFDEAAEGLYSAESLTPLNISISKALMISRVKRLFIIIVIPSFFVLNKYVKLFRLGLLLHVEDRGHVAIYSHHKNMIRKLVIDGQKYYDYTTVHTPYHDDYPKYHGLLWPEYMQKKLSYVHDSLGKKETKKYLSLNACAAELGVSTTYVKKRITEGIIKPIITKTGYFKIDMAQVKEAIGL